MVRVYLPRNSSLYLRGGGHVGYCFSTTGNLVVMLEFLLLMCLFSQSLSREGGRRVLARQGLLLRVQVLRSRLEESGDSPEWSDVARSQGGGLH